jgi:hypothetical protein
MVLNRFADGLHLDRFDAELQVEDRTCCPRTGVAVVVASAASGSGFMGGHRLELLWGRRAPVRPLGSTGGSALDRAAVQPEALELGGVTVRQAASLACPAADM